MEYSVRLTADLILTHNHFWFSRS